MESPEITGTGTGSTSNRTDQYGDEDEEEELKKLIPGKCKQYIFFLIMSICFL